MSYISLRSRAELTPARVTQGVTSPYLKANQPYFFLCHSLTKIKYYRNVATGTHNFYAPRFIKPNFWRPIWYIYWIYRGQLSPMGGLCLGTGLIVKAIRPHYKPNNRDYSAQDGGRGARGGPMESAFLPLFGGGVLPLSPNQPDPCLPG